MKVPCVSQPCFLQSFSLLRQDGLSPWRPWRRELALHCSGAWELRGNMRCSNCLVALLQMQLWLLMSLKVFSSTKKCYLVLANNFFPTLKSLERVLKIADHYIIAVIPDIFLLSSSLFKSLVHGFISKISICIRKENIWIVFRNIILYFLLFSFVTWTNAGRWA